MEFRLWGPQATTVELAISGTQLPMTASAGGWWTAEGVSAGPGTDYAFINDGGPRLPDPRSSWQPHGVHGPSRLLDHGAFRWTDGRWQPGPLSPAVLYELHIGTFTPAGTFEAAIDCLDHLVELGATHVELMPVSEFSGARGWGYDGVDLYAPHRAYGGIEGLKHLDAVHALVDTSAVPFLEQLAAVVNALEAHLGRHVVLIAESDLNDPRVVRPPELRGYGLAAQWSDDFHHTLHAVLTGERSGYYADFGALSDLAKTFTGTFVYDGLYSHFRDRRHGRPPAGHSGRADRRRGELIGGRPSQVGRISASVRPGSWGRAGTVCALPPQSRRQGLLSEGPAEGEPRKERAGSDGLFPSPQLLQHLS